MKIIYNDAYKFFVKKKFTIATITRQIEYFEVDAIDTDDAIKIFYSEPLDVQEVMFIDQEIDEIYENE